MDRIIVRNIKQGKDFVVMTTLDSAGIVVLLYKRKSRVKTLHFLFPKLSKPTAGLKN